MDWIPLDERKGDSPPTIVYEFEEHDERIRIVVVGAGLLKAERRVKDLMGGDSWEEDEANVDRWVGRALLHMRQMPRAPIVRGNVFV